MRICIKTERWNSNNNICTCSGKMEEIDKDIGGGHLRITGNGIDRNKLMQGEEVEFGIELDEAVFEEETQKYFDGEKVFKTLNFECCNDGEDSGTNDKTPFERMADGMEDITPTGDGGVLKKILINGVGSIVPQGAALKVHYNAYLEYSEEPFDSSILRNRQEHFKLGSGCHIAGLELALSSMKKNEKSTFLIKPKYAYGAMGCPPRIPADSTVMFEIELKSFVDVAKADEFEAKTLEERERMTFHDRLCLSDSLRQKGNDEFNQKHYQQALRIYKRAIDQLENCRLANEEEEKVMEAKCVPLYLNASVAALRAGNWKNAATFSRKALRLDKKNVKGLYGLGKALGQLGEFSDARRNLMKAQELAPSNKEIRDELKNLNDNIKQFQNMDKMISQKMFQPPEASQVKPANEKTDDSELQSMLDFIKDKIREFIGDKSQDKMYIPTTFSSVGLEQVRKIAEAESLVMDFEKETDQHYLKKT